MDTFGREKGCLDADLTVLQSVVRYHKCVPLERLLHLSPSNLAFASLSLTCDIQTATFIQKTGRQLHFLMIH